MADIEDVDEAPKSLVLFGRDCSKIPCFRESFINGIIGGFVIGTGTFLKTSKPRLACNYGMASYTLITLFYWSFCRYNWSKEKFFAAQIQEGMRLQVLHEGTDLERKIRAEYEESLKNADIKEA